MPRHLQMIKYQTQGLDFLLSYTSRRQICVRAFVAPRALVLIISFLHLHCAIVHPPHSICSFPLPYYSLCQTYLPTFSRSMASSISP